MNSIDFIGLKILGYRIGILNTAIQQQCDGDGAAIDTQVTRKRTLWLLVTGNLIEEVN